MALSGSFSVTQRDGKETVRCDWTGTQNVTNNTTAITAKLYFTNQYEIDIGTRTHTITIDGTAYNITSNAINTIGEHYLGSVTHTVTHNSDGAKSIAMSFVFSLKATLSGTYYESMSKSTSFSLNTIPRASQPTLSASSTAMGSAVTINTNRASSRFTHTLTYSFGSASGTIASGVGASTSWIIPITLAKQVPNATSGTGTITCKTYNGSTLIGTKSVSFTATVPASVVPNISAITCTDPMGYLSAYGGYVQNKSKVKVEVTAAGSYSSTIKSYKIVANGSTYTRNNSTTNVLTTAGANTITVTVTDSRGRTKTSTAQITVLGYVIPTVTELNVTRCDASGVVDESGAYMVATIQASITPLDDLNDKRFTLQYKKASDTLWTTWATYTTYTVDTTTDVEAISVDNSYNIRLVATDSFETIEIYNTIGTSFTLMDFRNTGKGIAFGKASEEDLLECALPTRFKTDVRSETDVIANLGTDNQVSLTELNEIKLENEDITFSAIATKCDNTTTNSLDLGTDKNGVVIISGYCSSITSGAFTCVLPKIPGKSCYHPVYNGGTLIYLLHFGIGTDGKTLTMKTQYSGNTSLYFYVNSVKFIC